MPCPVGVLLAEVPYLVRRGHPDVLTCALRKVVNHALEFRLSQPDEHTLQRVLRFPGFPHLVYLPFLIVHRAPLVGGRGTLRAVPAPPCAPDFAEFTFRDCPKTLISEPNALASGDSSPRR